MCDPIFCSIVVWKWLAMSDPNTATPTAPPIWRVVSFMAEPTPAFARGSDPMIESVHGARTFAMPRPISAVTPITSPTPGAGVRGQEQHEATRRRATARS